MTLTDRKTAKLDAAAFSTLRGVPNRSDREKVMSAFFQALGAFSRTFGTTMNSEVQKVLFFSKARKYSSALEMALDGPNIPVSRWRRLAPSTRQSCDVPSTNVGSICIRTRASGRAPTRMAARSTSIPTS